MIRETLHKLFAAQPDVLYGFADISYSPFYPEYRTALVFAVPYGRRVELKGYREAVFHDMIASTREWVNMLATQLQEALLAMQVHYLAPPMAQKDEIELLAPFSFKYAATRAELGWISRNDILITQVYGSHQRLCAILIDAELLCGEPIMQSRCPDGCETCVKVCPSHALRGASWNSQTLRSDIIDYHLCNKMRSKYIQPHGRKNDCGRCMAVCPVGRKTSEWK